MASNISRAQEIILCHLCDAKAIVLFCNPCQVNLCEECVGKHYMTSSSAVHEIVKYKDRKSHLIFTNCESHKSEKCTVHCQICDIPVCIKCLTGVHKGHEASDFSEIVESKKRQIEENTAHLENAIPQFDQADARIATNLADFISRCDELQIGVDKCGKEWHRIVDEIVDKNQKDIAKMKEDRIRELRGYQDENKNTQQLLMETFRQNRKIIESVDASAINEYKYKEGELHLRGPLEVKVNLPTFVPGQVNLSELFGNFGKLHLTSISTSMSNTAASYTAPTTKKLLEEIIQIAEFKTNDNLRHLCCTGTEEVWVSYDKKSKIECMNIHGSVRKSCISICMDWSGYPSGISVTNKGELVYTDKKSRSVNAYQDGRHSFFIMVEQGWQPMAVYCTKLEELLVSLKLVDDRACKIVRYKGQTITQEMIEDNRSDPLYKGGNKMLYVTENVNGDVVASDCNAKRVVVVNSAGTLRYHFKGHKSIKGKFTPGSIVTDSKGRILVEDDGNNCIQIIDQDGQYLRHLNYCGILSLDTLGRLWVGKFIGNKVNVIKYTK
ncbi:uncharacterized protein LOC134260353 [Saccostrea cucullata]|uniref:uncharacterized protein LOC134260353 n=1 Tax=Saccostrea cuccullata TaxID=36930 RepID=UPI002ED0F868